MKKQISTAQTDSNIQAVLQLLRVTPEKLIALSRGLSEQRLRQPLAPSERSPTQVLAHILNCEAISAEAIYLALLVDEPLLANIHAERDLGKLLRLDSLSFVELMDYFRFRRTVLLRVLEPLTEAQWARCVREHGKQRRETVYWRARGQALHELEHLQDLELKLAGNSKS